VNRTENIRKRSIEWQVTSGSAPSRAHAACRWYRLAASGHIGPSFFVRLKEQQPPLPKKQKGQAHRARPLTTRNTPQVNLAIYQISFNASCISRGPPNPVTGTPFPMSGVLKDSPNWPGEDSPVAGRK
jgi:hypothetical protein